MGLLWGLLTGKTKPDEKRGTFGPAPILLRKEGG